MHNARQSTTARPRRRVDPPPDANRAVDRLPSTTACVIKAIRRHREERANAGRERKILIGAASRRGTTLCG